MQTEFPRNATLPDQQARGRDACPPAARDTDEFNPTDDDLELIDMRYEQFVAQSRLEMLMYER